MVFDCKKWRQDSLSSMSSTFSGIYGMLLVCVYLTFSFTELVKFPELHLYLGKMFYPEGDTTSLSGIQILLNFEMYF